MTLALFRQVILSLILLSSGWAQGATAPDAPLYHAGSVPAESAPVVALDDMSHGCHDSTSTGDACPHGGGDICLCSASSALPSAEAITFRSGPLPTPQPQALLTQRLPAHDRALLRPPC